MYLTYGTSKSSPSVSLQHNSNTNAFTWLGMGFLLTVSTTFDIDIFNLSASFFLSIKNEYNITTPCESISHIAFDLKSVP
ncbi:hypothetical protein BpHYR1_005614 [Brachionus plicatilis]|uniref:Uncharacterized protein n=1 Tax=Brachionus plicatilis TaxID=10195 RepID=A0A3M7P6Z3_BRAPC|nr:hypothetical protein BpHYR1_005614 [Brachionus plicatilis]